MIKQVTFFALALGGMFYLTACQPAAPATPAERYEKALATGLSSKETTNELFLGLQLAVTDRQFYDRCTVLNREKKIEMGTGGNRVDHKMPTELARPAVLTFYPDFSTDQPRIIKAMDMELAYVDWSPWNKDAHADKLLEDIAQGWAVETFGAGFEVVPHPRHGKVLVQVKNNRRTAFWVVDERIVRGRATDLRAMPEEKLGLQ